MHFGTIGIGVLCLLMRPGALQASPDKSETPAARQAVCPKSASPAKTLWAVRIQDLDKDI